MSSESWSPESVPPAAYERPRLRPPIGIPTPPVDRRRSVVLAVALHALVLLAILTPVVAHMAIERITGAGGATAAGGGGGGLHGTGGDNGGWGASERLHFIQLPPAAPAAAAPAVTPPVSQPAPVVPPPPAKAKQPAPATPVAPSSPAPAAAGAPSATQGSGGGTGADGTNGSGPGSGGGIGAGVGTGQGSGEGPGTGGGTASVRPPQPRETFIMPIPIPRRIVGTSVTAIFDVDSTGRVVAFDFTPTADGGYNKKLRELFGTIRFRPGTRLDGTPIRAKVSLGYDL